MRSSIIDFIERLDQVFPDIFLDFKHGRDHLDQMVPPEYLQLAFDIQIGIIAIDHIFIERCEKDDIIQNRIGRNRLDRLLRFCFFRGNLLRQKQNDGQDRQEYDEHLDPHRLY